MKASDVMTRNVITVTPDMPLVDALKLMVEHRLSGLPVVDGGGALVGILTEGDLLRRAEIGTESKPSWLTSVFLPGRTAGNYVHSHARIIGDLMSWPVYTVGAEASLVGIVALMQAHRIKRVPVIDKERIIGIVSRADLLKALLRKISRASDVATSDAEMQRCIRAEISRLAWLPRFNVDVSVRNGVVELAGIVPDERERQALRVLVSNAVGAKAVRDNLVCVEPVSGAVIDARP